MIRKGIPVVFIILVGFVGGYFVSQSDNEVTEKSEKCALGQHRSYFDDKGFFEKAYSYIPGNVAEVDTASKEIKGVIVNHHLLAASLIAETMSTIVTEEPVTVVLISPNHFSAGRGRIISSQYNWQTPFGILESDCLVLETLQKAGVISVEEEPFELEHGISGVVPFIRKSLPNAKLVPIIVKDNTSSEELERFVDALGEVDKNILVVGSFDFSHYVSAKIAEEQDRGSLEIIKNFEIEKVADVAIDSKPGLEILLRYMQQVGAGNFNLVVNMNSVDIIGKDVGDTTSYLNGFFYK